MRKYLLDCFRLVLQESIDPNIIEAIRDALQEVIGRVLQKENSTGGGPSFVRKCLQNMGEMKSMLQNLTDRLNGASVLGQVQRPEFLETFEYQRVSLVQQHESLGIIVHYLVKANYAAPNDFEQLLDVLKRADKYDNLLGMAFSSSPDLPQSFWEHRNDSFIFLWREFAAQGRFRLIITVVHFIPAFAAFIFAFGAPEGFSTLREARNWNEKIVGHKDQNPWALHYVHVAVCAWWLAEYGGWYMDNQTGSPLNGVNLEEGQYNSFRFSI
jgi:nuclear pore complex protein Nup205